MPLLALVAFVGAGALAARGRTLHVLNLTPTPARVSIDGGAALDVQSGARLEVPLGEGEHVAVVERDGRREEVALSLRTPWLSRLTARPLFVLDVAGAAPLVLEQAVYGEGAEPMPPQAFFGAPFVSFQHVDLAFAPFEREVATDAPALTRTRVDVLPGAPAAVLARLPRGTPTARRMDWAELRLGLDPDDEALVRAYRDLLGDDDEVARCLAFLEGGLARRPVAVAWHRTYQDLARARGGEEALAARYAELLAATPDDAALLYLAGRLEPEAAAALARYDAAVAADPGFAFAWHGKAFVALARGQGHEAARCAAEATRLRPDDAELAAVHDDARLAAGQLAPLRADLEAQLAARPLSINAHRRLLEVLVAQGQASAARERHAAFARAARAGAPRDAELVVAVSAAALADLERDAAALLAAAAELPGGSSTRAAHELAGHLARGELAPAAALVETGPLRGGPRHALLVSVAFARAGDAAQARAWRERAAGWLEGGTRRERRVAALLRADRAPGAAELDALALPPVEAATVCAALALAWPEAAGWLDARVARACHGRYFPAWFLAPAPE